MTVVVTLDFETYFDSECSLRKLSYEQYINHPSFKVHCVGIKINDQPTFVINQNIQEYLETLIQDDTIVVAHNMLFDGAVLEFYYGIAVPIAYCTLAMARATWPFQKHGLDNVAKLCFPDKQLGKTEGLFDTKGKTFLSTTEMQVLSDYCKNDVDLTFECFKTMYPAFPAEELAAIDLTFQMYLKRILKVDEALVKKYLTELERDTAAKIKASNLPKSLLSSSKQFAEWIESKGIPIKQIASPTPNNPSNMKWPFSQSDLEWGQLQFDYPEYKHVWEARKAVAARQEITRAKTFLDNSDMQTRLIGVPLKYAGAHTLRWSGTNKINLQNLQRKSPLRNALAAQEGFELIIADSSNIEARLLAWYAQEPRLLSIYKNRGDPYIDFAEQIFGAGLTKENNEKERYVGKVCVLGLGYGMGWRKLRHTFVTGAMGEALNISAADAKHYVQVFRTMYKAIPAFWRTCDYYLMKMHDETANLKQRGLTIRHKALQMPDGMLMQYPQLQSIASQYGTNSSYFNGKHKVNLYGGKLTENIIQRAARCMLRDIMLEVNETVCKDSLANIVLQVHDEIVVHCPTRLVETALPKIEKAFKRIPEWCDDSLTLDLEIKISNHFTK